ncbi:MAG: DUF1552 domain-containing protein [Myxococcota bacterium]
MRRRTRRDFLATSARGALATLGASLPAQLGWMRAAFGQATAPSRVVIVFVANGAPEEGFFPDGPTSTSAAFPTINAPLERWRDHLQIVSGVHTHLPGSNATAGGHGGPYRMLNAGRFGEFKDTFDTSLGRLWGMDTPFENLLVGTMMDSGPSYALTTRAGAPQYYERSPLRAFSAMFDAGGAVDTTDFDRKKKILDVARTQVRRFRAELGSLERAKLDEHAEAIDRVDNLIRPPAGAGAFCDAPTFNEMGFSGDVNRADQFEAITDLHIELMALAFRCNMTRMATFALCGDEGEPSIPSVLPQGFHGGSVHADRGRYTQYRRYFASRVGALLDKLSTTPDLDGGNLLDNTLVLVTSNMGDGSVHGNPREYVNLPIILAGGRNLGNRVGYYTNLGYDASDPIRYLGDAASRRYVHGNLMDTVAAMAGVDVSAPSWPRYGGDLEPISDLMA